MKYKTALKLNLELYPNIFPLKEYSVLEHMFFVNGNGLWWKNGELTDGLTIKEKREQHKRFEEEQLSLIKDMLKILKGKEIRKEVESWLTNGYYGPPPDKPDPNIKYELYPLWEKSTIMELPDNIKDDWLLAAEKALDMVRDGVFIASEEDKKFLKKARKRVNELKKKRGL